MSTNPFSTVRPGNTNFTRTHTPSHPVPLTRPPGRIGRTKRNKRPRDCTEGSVRYPRPVFPVLERRSGTFQDPRGEDDETVPPTTHGEDRNPYPSLNYRSEEGRPRGPDPELSIETFCDNLQRSQYPTTVRTRLVGTRLYAGQERRRRWLKYTFDWDSRIRSSTSVHLYKYNSCLRIPI